MARSQHTFSKRQREKAKQKKNKEKMERREERKQENSSGLEIDWGSAPTEKTLLENGISPDEVSEENQDNHQKGEDEKKEAE